MGVIDTLQTAAAVVLAAPIAMLGGSFLLDGDPLGVGFLLIAVLLVVVQRYLLTPKDLPLEAAEVAAERVVAEPEAKEDDEDAD